MKRIFIAGAFILFAAILQAQNVGIGVPVPLQKLDVNGAIRLGNTGTSNPGTLRYNIGRFEGYDGLNWNWLNGFKLPLDTSVDVSGGYVLNIYNSNFSSPQSSAISGITSSSDGVGLYGENTYNLSSSGIPGNGVLGKSSGEGAGVKGINIGGIGVEGTGGAVGVLGSSGFGIAIQGIASGNGATGLDISAHNNLLSTAAIFRHPIINGKALIVEKGFVGIGEISPTALLSVKGTEATGNGLAAAITLENAASSNKWNIRAGGPGTITPDGGFSIADNTDYRFIIGATGNIGLGIAPSIAKLHLNGTMKIEGLNTLEFGAGVAGKETNAGKIGYQTFTAGALDIVGAGTLVSNRKVNIFAEGGTTFNGPVGIGILSPASSAKLDISSTTQGFLPPRMTSTQRDAITPAEGLMIYNTTTKKPSFYDGTEWQNFDGSFAYGIGDNYQGGKIAYIFQPGDPGYIVGQTHGLIAAASNQGTFPPWGCQGTAIPGADGTVLGTGNQNTIDITAGCATAGIAARICGDLVLNGYSDWHLPARDELNKLYINRVAVGGFGSDAYWSSSESGINDAWFQFFSTGVQNLLTKNSGIRVRAVRAF